MTITHDPRDPVIDGALIRSSHVLDDVAEAARAYYRPLSTRELSKIAGTWAAALQSIPDREIFTSANAFITSCELGIDDLELDDTDD